MAAEQLTVTKYFECVSPFFQRHQWQPRQGQRDFNRFERVIALNRDFSLKQGAIVVEIYVPDFERFAFGQFGQTEIDIRGSRLHQLLNGLGPRGLLSIEITSHSRQTISRSVSCCRIAPSRIAAMDRIIPFRRNVWLSVRSKENRREHTADDVFARRLVSIDMVSQE